MRVWLLAQCYAFVVVPHARTVPSYLPMKLGPAQFPVLPQVAMPSEMPKTRSAVLVAAIASGVAVALLSAADLVSKKGHPTAARSRVGSISMQQRGGTSIRMQTQTLTRPKFKSAPLITSFPPPTAPASEVEVKEPAKPASTGFGKPIVIGLSHKTATVEVREKMSIKQKDWNKASEALCKLDSIQEAAVLSTCNRFEVYIVAEDQFAAIRDTLAYLRDHSGLPDSDLRPNLFVLYDRDATWHLLRVSSGLESLVVGEGQILSQVKACHQHATQRASEDDVAGSAGKVLGRLLNTAVMAGKFVRSETEIAKGAVSISSAAVELAIMKAPIDLGKPLGELRVSVVGAGTMSKLLMTHLCSKGVTKVTLLNRSRQNAEDLAAQYPDCDVDVKLMDEFWPSVRQSDLVFTSTSAGVLVSKSDLEAGADAGAGPAAQLMQRLMLIDISVPRNVDANANEVDGVFAYNVDDLKEVVAANQEKRKHKIMEAEVLLRVELAKFLQWQESLCYVPALQKLQDKFETVRQAELKKAKKKGLKSCSEEEWAAIDLATKGILNKLLHAPMVYLRADDNHGLKVSVDQIEDIFQLGHDPR